MYRSARYSQRLSFKNYYYDAIDAFGLHPWTLIDREAQYICTDTLRGVDTKSRNIYSYWSMREIFDIV